MRMRMRIGILHTYPNAYAHAHVKARALTRTDTRARAYGRRPRRTILYLLVHGLASTCAYGLLRAHVKTRACAPTYAHAQPTRAPNGTRNRTSRRKRLRVRLRGDTSNCTHMQLDMTGGCKSKRVCACVRMRACTPMRTQTPQAYPYKRMRRRRASVSACAQVTRTRYMSCCHICCAYAANMLRLSRDFHAFQDSTMRGIGAMLDMCGRHPNACCGGRSRTGLEACMRAS